MSNPSKAKGTAAEVAIRDYIRAAGWIHCERLPTEGAKDRGDLTGIDPRLVVEIKNCKTMDLGGWLRETAAEVANARAEIGVVWHKRRGTTDPGDWFVTMTGADFIELLHAYTQMPFPTERSA